MREVRGHGPTCAQGYNSTGRVGTLGVLAYIVQALQNPARDNTEVIYLLQFEQSGALSLVRIVEIVLSLVESFIHRTEMMSLRQLSYAIKNQLGHPKPSTLVLYGKRAPGLATL